MIKMIEEVKYIMFIINGSLVDYSNISLLGFNCIGRKLFLLFLEIII